MAESRHSVVRAGILILAGITILGFAILSIGHGARLFTGSENFEAHFQRINGLQAGAPVKLSGVTIGAVDSIGFPSDPTADYVVVKLWIQRAAASRVRGDSEAQIRSMGLLGDKYVELSPGTSASPPAAPGAVLRAENPIDYESLLQRKGTDDLFANIIAISDSLRSMLKAVDQGQGLLGELVHGQPPGSAQRPLTLAAIRQTLENANRVSSELEITIRHINRGRGVIGAMLSGKPNGRQFLANLSSSATSLRRTTRDLDQLINRFQAGQGLLPELMENRQLANRVMGNLQQSSEDLSQILHKINTGQGTLGAMVNDPSLYNEAKGALSGGGGWGLSILKALYSITHPFAASSETGGQQAAQPAHFGPSTITTIQSPGDGARATPASESPVPGPPATAPNLAH